MPLIIACLDHIVLRTAQLEKMLRFYCDVLGCTVERELPPETGLVQLRAGAALIDIVPVDSELGRVGGGPPSQTENNLDHFCLLLEPLSPQQITEHLKRNNISVGEFAERYGSEGFGQSIYIQDPEGNTVELRSKKPPLDG